ncbi:MAG: hypothetical protein ACRDL7_00310 [Gaiellaceae bacterium]
MRLIRRLLTVRRPTPPPKGPADPERLQRIYRETQRQVESLRRAA